MNDIELLKELFGNKLIKPENGIYGKPCIKLEEIAQDNSYSVTIAQVPENTVAIKTDGFPDLKGFFQCSSETGQCKRADFVIITDDKLIFIELSTAKKLKKEVVQQLKGGQCVVEYCQSIGRKFYDNASFLKNRDACFVSIYEIGVNKKSQRILPKNNSLNHFLKISAPKRLQFNALCPIK